MIFWDTSALVPLLVSEESSDGAREVLERDPGMVVWWGTPVEVQSALARLDREGTLGRADVDRARGLLAVLSESWSEVAPTEEVRGHAARLLLRHPIRAADALQLGAALVWARGRPTTHALLTLDDRLAEAARREGFRLVKLDAS